MSTPEQIQSWKDYDAVVVRLLKLPPVARYRQIELESRWDHYDSQGRVKSSPTGSMGLGQLNSKFYPRSDWEDPQTNLNKSGSLVRAYKDEFGTWRKAFAAYNWGPGHVRGGRFDDGRGFGVQDHSPWTGERYWVCTAGHTMSGQCIYYLDYILGPEWAEPAEYGAPAEPQPQGPETPPDPTPAPTVYSVGPGVLGRMAELGDQPATNETYINEAWSITYGQSGREYIYLKSTNRTHVFEPRNIAAVSGPKPGGVGSPSVPWDREQLITNGFSTPEEWQAEFGVRRSIQAVVWHDMEGYLAGAIARWNTGAAGAHLCVLRDGSVVLTVKLENVAWHAGTSNNPGSDTYGRTPYWRTHNINPYSVGVELEGFVASGYTDAQIQACIRIGKYLKDTYNVPSENVAEVIRGHHLHSELSAMRSDPGPLFPFSRILKEVAS